MTQDTAPMPHWDMTAKHTRAIDAFLRRVFPDMESWENKTERGTEREFKAMGFRVITKSGKITVSKGDRVVIFSGDVEVSGQTGGDCRASGNATLTSSGQTGGDCRAYNNATLTSSGQTGGYCWAHDNATLTSSGQTGGYCWAYNNAKHIKLDGEK